MTGRPSPYQRAFSRSRTCRNPPPPHASMTSYVITAERTVAVAVEPLRAGDPGEIAGYRLGARLGAGGMGQVYLAFTRGGRPVALKVVRPDLGDDPDFRRRFRQEVAA